MFEQIVAASGLAPVIAGSALRRALARAGVHSTKVTPEELAKALDFIEACLRVYLPNPEVADRMEILRGLAKGRPSVGHHP